MSFSDEAVAYTHDNLARHNHFTLGTINEDGSPWVICANAAYDERFNIIWKSHENTVHSRNIARDPRVSICVYDDDETDDAEFGFYAKAKARLVTDRAELEHLLEVRFRQRGGTLPPVDEFIGKPEIGLYIAELTEAWVTDARHLKLPVDLEQLSR